MSVPSPLGKLGPDTFLERYWQKQPCLIRDAFPGYLTPISPEELAGLACEEGVEARLVAKSGRQPGWSVRHGPFKETDFTALPARNWTLLVQDVDKYVPRIAELLDCFRFVPNWRIDDVMISYAADGGGVGPHVDAYDVFLLQVQGFRRWSISTVPHVQLEAPGLELKQIKDFRPRQEWLLAPGDMLYLPPGVAHDGIAVGDCMTFSIGFRTPADTEMLADLSGWLLERLSQDSRYADPGLTDASGDPGLISSNARRQMRQRLKSALTLDSDEFEEWFGCFITEPKPWLAISAPRRQINNQKLRVLLEKFPMARHAQALMCWMPGQGNRIHLFVNGHRYTVSARLKELVQYLTRERRYSKHTLQTLSRSRDAQQLLIELYNAGAIRRA